MEERKRIKEKKGRDSETGLQVVSFERLSAVGFGSAFGFFDKCRDALAERFREVSGDVELRLFFDLTSHHE